MPTDDRDDEEIERDDDEATDAEDAEDERDDGADDDGADDDGADDDGADDDGADDDGADDDGADDDGADDDGADDDGADDEPASAARASGDDGDEPSSSRAGRATGKDAKKAERQKSAATRLAAARAAKAARKAAKRGKELKEEKAPLDTIADTAVAQRVASFGDWASENRPTVYAIVGAIVIAIAGTIGYLQYRDAQLAAAGAALSAAVEIANARIRDEEEIPGENDPPSYTSVTARAEAAIAAFDAVVAQHGGTPAAAWAHLGRGQALMALERYADARAAFQAAIDADGSDGAVLWRALEGKGFTFEAEEDWAQAAEAYTELGRIEDGRFDPVAKYHLARSYIARDQREQATDTLRTLVESLRNAADDESAQDFAYVLAQAEVRLRELDPSAVPARPTLGGGPGGGLVVDPGAGGDSPQITPEQIQEMLRRMQQQGGGEDE
ncbi:MAG: tetratricopeptide repeat protein [Sandaracinaceae bacterium]|nr:tetratricopeptide repeat protein [Sandaracinaceae bacterium]